MKKMVLFDLDGTLLPMDQDDFANAYFSRLANYMFPFGYDPKQIIACVWKGTKAMVQNNGQQTNEEVFWNVFNEAIGKDVSEDMDRFMTFYREEFPKTITHTTPNPKAKEVVNHVKNMGYRVALATNPIFPRVATEERVRWTGLQVDDFEHVTTYENSVYCKPNLDYYKELCSCLNVLPEECIMVGNDVSEDGVARELGIDVYIIQDCLMNPKEEDLSSYPIGTFSDFLTWLNEKEYES